MVIFRLVFGLLLLASLLCFAAFLVTRNPVWLRRGVRILGLTLVTGLLFFAGMTIERLL